jgi:hypothetical protein
MGLYMAYGGLDRVSTIETASVGRNYATYSVLHATVEINGTNAAPIVIEDEELPTIEDIKAIVDQEPRALYATSVHEDDPSDNSRGMPADRNGKILSLSRTICLFAH